MFPSGKLENITSGSETVKYLQLLNYLKERNISQKNLI